MKRKILVCALIVVMIFAMSGIATAASNQNYKGIIAAKSGSQGVIWSQTTVSKGDGTTGAIDRNKHAYKGSHESGTKATIVSRMYCSGHTQQVSNLMTVASGRTVSAKFTDHAKSHDKGDAFKMKWGNSNSYKVYIKGNYGVQ